MVYTLFHHLLNGVMARKLKTPALSSLIGQWLGQNRSVTVVPPVSLYSVADNCGFNYGKCSSVYCLNLIIHPAIDSFTITICWMRKLQPAVWWRELLVCGPGQLWPSPIPSPSRMPDHSIRLTGKRFGGSDLNRTTQRWRCAILSLWQKFFKQSVLGLRKNEMYSSFQETTLQNEKSCWAPETLLSSQNHV